MKHFLVAALVSIFCFTTPTLAQTTADAPLTFDDIFTYIHDNQTELNETVPTYLRSLIGNKSLQFTIETLDGTEYAWVQAENGSITTVQAGQHPNPDIVVSTNLNTINKLNASAEDTTQASTLIRQAISSGDISIEFLLIDKVAEQIYQAEPVIETSLVAATPIIAVANPSILAYLPHLRVLVAHFLNWILSLFGLKKKRQPWATIYDATSKQPLALAVVRLYKTDAGQTKLADTQVTDKNGRFGFLPQTGQHRLEVVKPQFIYPSALVTNSPDNAFESIYRGETLTEKTTTKIIGAGIPLDPSNPRDHKAAGNPIWRLCKHFFQLISNLLLTIGLVISIGLVIFDVTAINIAVVILYLALISLHFKLKPKKMRYWGVVYQSDTLTPVPLANVSLVDTKYNKRLQTHLSDYQGRFAFFPPAGDYTLLVQKTGFTFPSKQKTLGKKYRTYFGEAFTVKHQGHITPLDIPLDADKK